MGSLRRLHRNLSGPFINLPFVDVLNIVPNSVWDPAIYLEILDKIKRKVSGFIHPQQASRIQSLANGRDVASLCLNRGNGALLSSGRGVASRCTGALLIHRDW